MNYPVRGKIVITPQLLHQMLGLPPQTEVIGFDSVQNRLEVIIRSDKQILGLTYPTAEGQEIASVTATSHYGVWHDSISPAHMVIYERVRNLLVGTVPDDEPVESEEDETRC